MHSFSKYHFYVLVCYLICISGCSASSSEENFRQPVVNKKIEEPRMLIKSESNKDGILPITAMKIEQTIKPESLNNRNQISSENHLKAEQETSKSTNKITNKTNKDNKSKTVVNKIQVKEIRRNGGKIETGNKAGQDSKIDDKPKSNETNNTGVELFW